MLNTGQPPLGCRPPLDVLLYLCVSPFPHVIRALVAVDLLSLHTITSAFYSLSTRSTPAVDMLSFIIAILLHICLADAPAGLYLRGNVQGSLILAVPTLAAIILVLGLALIPSVATKFIGIILAASILVVYYVHTSLPVPHALGFIHVRLVAFGLPGAFSFVDCSAEVVWPVRALALLAFGIFTTGLSQTVTIRLASAVPAACVGCLSFAQILSRIAVDLKGVEASLKDARSAAADAKARLAQKEADLAKVKGVFNGIHIQSDVRIGL